MTLRPYQATAVESALRALATSGSAVLQMPTGAGKTKAATAIIERASKPVWFICHRQEIERQASRAFSAAGIEHGIVSPRAKPDYGKRVQIVSVATLARRLAELPAPKLAIWDECHHVAAKSWAKIREALADSRHLGLTATPERLDGKGLAEWFNELVTGPSTRELIDGGWLSDFRYFAPSEPDLTGARLQAGDYYKKDLAKAMGTPVLIGDAIAEYQKNAAGKRALVFCASVEASQELVRRFNESGVPALHVDGKTPTVERDEAVQRLASGEIKVLSNVEVFTEGFDLPAIDAVILLRPTKSLALFLQMIGRALRRAEGKDGALIFDHAGLWLDHDWFDLPIEWSLEGGARQRRLTGRTAGPRRCPECKEVRPVREPVCACGYEFPTGREIGEYDGVLRELRGGPVDVPEGCELIAHWAKRHGLGSSTVSRWARAGKMSLAGDYVNSAEADAWLAAGGPGGKFLAIRPPSDVPDSSAYISIPSAARLLNVQQSTVRAWLKSYEGPVAGNGWVRLYEFLDWFLKNPDIRVPTPANNEEYIPAKQVFERLGFSGNTAGSYKLFLNLCRKDVRGNISWKDASDKWKVFRLAQDSFRRPPSTAERPDDYEPGVRFAERLGVTTATVGYWKRKRKSQIPHAKNGWIPIVPGLEWVRDNTKIEIPPEAWPSANDNDNAPTKRAA